jgi:hypothetical protein
MEVPPPVEPAAPVVPAPVLAVAPLPPVVEPAPPVEPAPVLAVLLVSLGELVVEGVLEEAEPAPASSFLPQAVRERAAIRARAAHCAIGDLIIRNS